MCGILKNHNRVAYFGIGERGSGKGDQGKGIRENTNTRCPMPNPQCPIPNPQSPIPFPRSPIPAHLTSPYASYTPLTLYQLRKIRAISKANWGLPLLISHRNKGAIVRSFKAPLNERIPHSKRCNQVI